MELTRAIEIELQKATGVKRRQKETKAKFVRRLIRSADKLEDDDWMTLSEAAQEFVGVARNRRRVNVADDVGESGGHVDRPVRTRVYDIVLANPTIPKTTLLETLANEGFKVNRHTIGSARRHFRMVLEYLRSRGLLVEPEEGTASEAQKT